MSRPSKKLLRLIDRLDHTLRRVAAYPTDVKAIYLTQADHETLTTAVRSRAALFYRDTYRGHPVRIGKASRVYGRHGVCFSITAPRASSRTQIK